MKISHLQFLILSLLIVGFSLYFYLSSDLYSDELLNSTGSLVTIFWLISLAVLLISGINKASSTVYFGFLTVLGIFHLGIPLSGFFNYEGTYFLKYIDRWYFDSYTRESLLSVYVFITGYLLSYLYTPFNKSFLIKNDFFVLRDKHLIMFFRLFVLFIITWLVIVKVVFRINDYAVYNTSSQIPILSFLFVYVNSLIGFLLIVLSTSRKYSKKALYFFFFWAFFAFPLGLRGEVIFPLVLALPLLIINDTIKVNYTKAISSIILVLTLSSLVFIYRNDSASTNDMDVSPIATIAELGGSLRPLYEVSKWLESGEMDYQYGATYYAPFERIFLKAFAIKNRLPAEEDFRLMNVAMSKKAGPYGFSIIAEAKINFSWFGLFFIGFLIGVFCKKTDVMFNSSRINLIMLCLVFAIFFHIRQSFVGAFGTFTISLLLSLSVIYLTSLKKRVRYEV